MLPQTINVIYKLREINKSLDGALKINDFADSYIEECLLTNQPVNLITPWSLSRSFTKRYCEQGNKFSPTKNEEKLFRKEIPAITSIFKENGFTFNWWLSFSRSYTRENSMSETMEKEYISMITNLVEINNSEIAIINWEDDVIGMKHRPNKTLSIEENFLKIVNQKDFNLEVNRRKERAKSTLSLKISDDELIKETRFKVSCEAEEGIFLMGNKENPLCEPGKFLFLILGKAERYNFFSILTPEFKKRILCVLKPYPWRL